MTAVGEKEEEAEIEAVSRLVRVPVADRREHVEKVRDMLSFFEMLDLAGVEDDELEYDAVELSRLRRDCHEAFDLRLADYMRQYRDGYVRAPKMG